ncbi:winged helix-turn-helix domain-containing protein [Methylobrevis pamukkalensis]|uniref:winged helix-turn-helix domain-containing protein n=1 Tax=Methylobrevis pamukkalensis TaxID=1439726 RepID=UPI001FD9B80C|nr:winged helix-turn-helix domain-containing protein [Methylobrevis pamukkalensis]
MRIELAPGRRLGPGKIALMEAIAAHGSISAAGRAMDMSYRRAWQLVEEINALFGKPLVDSKVGGRRGGGASLTPAGLVVVARYRAIERAAGDLTRQHLDALAAELPTGGPGDDGDASL